MSKGEEPLEVVTPGDTIRAQLSAGEDPTVWYGGRCGSEGGGHPGGAGGCGCGWYGAGWYGAGWYGGMGPAGPGC